MQKAENWIFLRGLAHEAGHWGSFTQAFEQNIDGAKVHALDFPGAGVHHELKAPLSVRTMTDFVRAEFKKLNLKGPCILFSISLGSMVAFDWVTRYPDDFVGIVLMNTSFGSFSPPYKRLYHTAYPTVIKLPMAKSTHDREYLTLGMVSNREDIHEETAKKWAELHERHPIKKMAIIRQLWAATFFIPPRAKPRIPTLILSSAADHMVHPSCSRAIAQAWGLPLPVHPTAGHDVVLDDPKWVLEKVSEWLKTTA